MCKVKRLRRSFRGKSAVAEKSRYVPRVKKAVTPFLRCIGFFLHLMVSGGASVVGANERLASRMLLDFARRVNEHRAPSKLFREAAGKRIRDRSAESGPGGRSPLKRFPA
ncbi:hypothetical protein DQG23_20170 [Paenibacillus contaminans]|uniref:Uncharacterized protein n=1 Tax=Paenibacillus contaminans TaxID=450362 RepID=A0A329MN35_9BACL|nr:hypothetical protein DQG23_20170 [Paenibacillus contaminans]